MTTKEAVFPYSDQVLRPLEPSPLFPPPRMMLPAQDKPARDRLRRAKRLALCLLLFMAGLSLLALFIPSDLGGGWVKGMIGAAANAGLIGGLADWFAVTALFRHPLGLPVPHTAIIPAQKQRLGQALGRFVAQHVFTPEEISRAVKTIDMADIFQRLLNDPSISLPTSQAGSRLVPRLLSSMESGRARKLVIRLLPRLMGGQAASAVIARALNGLVDGGKHQDIFTLLLNALRDTLHQKESQLHELIAQRVSEHGGRLVGWAVGAQIASKVLTAINVELDKMGPDQSVLRLAFDEWVRVQIGKLQNDPAHAAEIGKAVTRLMAEPAAQAWLKDIWQRLRSTIIADANKRDGRTVLIIQGFLGELGAMLGQSPDMRDKLNNGAEAIILNALPSLQDSLSQFIASVVARWDTQTITDRLELRIGHDLQFVRVNGTLVGFVAGGALYAVLRVISSQIG
ncbi:DUF445 domain-containing protein [Granulibacter bethesdensis]|uniref:DUF445 domain-containing protein n=1 Tax=Granulibacter bethesdensis TaxID=364410 RepID=UPI00090BFC41|nr:DUF445 domain-containing protein [Granulibacter bethesdensis]APH59668.1 putative membrane spanning protein [Granulibacter bethesdensis]